MPLVRFDLIKGRTDKEIADLLDAAHEAMLAPSVCRCATATRSCRSTIASSAAYRGHGARDQADRQGRRRNGNEPHAHKRAEAGLLPALVRGSTEEMRHRTKRRDGEHRREYRCRLVVRQRGSAVPDRQARRVGESVSAKREVVRPSYSQPAATQPANTMSKVPASACASMPSPGSSLTMTLSRWRRSAMPLRMPSRWFSGSPATYICVMRGARPDAVMAKWICGVRPG